MTFSILSLSLSNETINSDTIGWRLVIESVWSPKSLTGRIMLDYKSRNNLSKPKVMDAILPNNLHNTRTVDESPRNENIGQDVQN